jgi:hypothetical protein
MIPRKIHYCWLSGEEIPQDLQRCIESWRKVMPDYEVVKWDTSNFDVNSNTFVAEAYRLRKWAFATDYIRLHALHLHGGIYLDSDVLVRRRFDEFLPQGFFSAVEYHHKLVRQRHTQELLHADGTSIHPRTPKPGIGLQAAVMGAEKGHPFLKDCLDFYHDRHFILPDGSYFDQVIAPDIFAMFAEEYGFRYRDERQHIRENMLILPSDIIAGGEDQATWRSYAVHRCAGSWRDKAQPGLVERMLRQLYWGSGLKRMIDTRLEGRRQAAARQL